MTEEDVATLGPRELSAHYRALADTTRLRIMRALWQQQNGTVTDLCKELRVSQPLMSWHLRILRRAGLVTTHRTGRQVHCRVEPSIIRENGDLLGRFLSSGTTNEPSYEPARRTG
ncbi:MAG TPA: metalloregulator ArsR/SmtB family transcription factor [Chloroflexota bacterium]|nr:metalloregulator ArsR/SmtB family transcription factor [Chloroflexota bacterium]